jgi:hypothetical protein
MLIFRWSDCIIAAFDIVPLCKRLFSAQVKSGLSPLLTSARKRGTDLKIHAEWS